MAAAGTSGAYRRNTGCGIERNCHSTGGRSRTVQQKSHYILTVNCKTITPFSQPLRQTNYLIFLAMLAKKRP